MNPKSIYSRTNLSLVMFRVVKKLVTTVISAMKINNETVPKKFKKALKLK